MISPELYVTIVVYFMCIMGTLATVITGIAFAVTKENIGTFVYSLCVMIVGIIFLLI